MCECVDCVACVARARTFFRLFSNFTSFHLSLSLLFSPLHLRQIRVLSRCTNTTGSLSMNQCVQRIEEGTRDINVRRSRMLACRTARCTTKCRQPIFYDFHLRRAFLAHSVLAQPHFSYRIYVWRITIICESNVKWFDEKESSND